MKKPPRGATRDGFGNSNNTSAKSTTDRAIREALSVATAGGVDILVVLDTPPSDHDWFKRHPWRTFRCRPALAADLEGPRAAGITGPEGATHVLVQAVVPGFHRVEFIHATPVGGVVGTFESAYNTDAKLAKLWASLERAGGTG